MPVSALVLSVAIEGVVGDEAFFGIKRLLTFQLIKSGSFRLTYASVVDAYVVYCPINESPTFNTTNCKWGSIACPIWCRTYSIREVYSVNINIIPSTYLGDCNMLPSLESKILLGWCYPMITRIYMKLNPSFFRNVIGNSPFLGAVIAWAFANYIKCFIDNIRRNPKCNWQVAGAKI